MADGHSPPLAAGAYCLAAAILLSQLFLAGCDRHPPAATTQPALASPRIVSLVPAATDLILAMGAQDHLAGISNYDQDSRTAGLPRVGDYLTTDWEKISQLHAQVVLTQFPEGRTPEGFLQRAGQLGMRQENLQIHRLADLFPTIKTLGAACGEPRKAQTLADHLRARLDAVRKRVANEPRVASLIVVDDVGRSVAGRDNYLDDLLDVAGGTNVMPPGVPWPTIDRERLVSLAPQVILQLMPAASEQVQAQAARNWAELSQIPAVRDHRVVPLTQWNVMMPGYEVADVAEQFADALHPATRNHGPTTATPSTQGGNP